MATDIGGIWADGAPDVTEGVTPTPLVTYAKSGMTQEEIEAGWPYGKIVDSAAFNEVMKRLTTFLQFPNLLETDGYQMLPGGLIIQWGTTEAFTSEEGKTVTFPLEFPTANLCQIATPDISANIGVGANVIAQVYSPTVTTMGVYCQVPDTTSGTFSFPMKWVALGY